MKQSHMIAAIVAILIVVAVAVYYFYLRKENSAVANEILVSEGGTLNSMTVDALMTKLIASLKTGATNRNALARQIANSNVGFMVKGGQYELHANTINPQGGREWTVVKQHGGGEHAVLVRGVNMAWPRQNEAMKFKFDNAEVKF